MERRVPTCTINWCCPFRSNLCRGECHGSTHGRARSRAGDPFHLFVLGDDVFVMNAGDGTRYQLDAAGRQVLMDFDRGAPAGDLIRDFHLLPAEKKTAK
jgi:hypothetical protein